MASTTLSRLNCIRQVQAPRPTVFDARYAASTGYLDLWQGKTAALLTTHRCLHPCDAVLLLLCACSLQRDESCLDAVAAASSQLTDEAQVLTQARQLSRCLAFRQLLSEALTQALAAGFPAAESTVEAVASNMQVYAAEGSGRAAQAAAGDWGGLVAGRHVCDVFELPRPGLQSVGSPAVADPVVVNTLVGECHRL